MSIVLPPIAENGMARNAASSFVRYDNCLPADLSGRAAEFFDHAVKNDLLSCRKKLPGRMPKQAWLTPAKTVRAAFASNDIQFLVQQEYGIEGGEGQAKMCLNPSGQAFLFMGR